MRKTSAGRNGLVMGVGVVLLVLGAAPIAFGQNPGAFQPVILDDPIAGGLMLLGYTTGDSLVNDQ